MVRRILALVLLLAPVPAMAAELALECCPSRCVGPACVSPGRGTPRAGAAIDLGIYSIQPGFKGFARAGATVSMIVAVRNWGRTSQRVTVAVESESGDDRVVPPPAQTVRPGTAVEFTLRLKITPRHTKGRVYERTVYIARAGGVPFTDSRPKDNQAELRVEVALKAKELPK